MSGIRIVIKKPRSKSGMSPVELCYYLSNVNKTQFYTNVTVDYDALMNSILARPLADREELYRRLPLDAQRKVESELALFERFIDSLAENGQSTDPKSVALAYKAFRQKNLPNKVKEARGIVLVKEFRKFFEEKKAAYGDDWKRHRGSWAKYQNTLKHLNGYAPDALVTDIDSEWMAGFVAYLQSKGVSNNSISETIAKALKAFLNQKFPTLIDGKKAVSKKRPKVRYGHVIYLNSEDRAKLKEVYPSLPGHLKDSYDVFMAMCFTGLRHVDFKRLRPERDLYKENGQHFIKIWQQKTTEPLTLPVHREVLEILTRVIGRPNKRQNLNENIQEICRIAGINQQIEDVKIIGDKAKRTLYPKWQLITSKIARKTFGRMLNDAGASVKDISLLLGHTSEKHTRRYLGLDSKEAASYIDKLQF